jgi:hypothetical protein
MTTWLISKTDVVAFICVVILLLFEFDHPVIAGYDVPRGVSVPGAQPAALPALVVPALRKGRKGRGEPLFCLFHRSEAWTTPHLQTTVSKADSRHQALPEKTSRKRLAF